MDIIEGFKRLELWKKGTIVGLVYRIILIPLLYLSSFILGNITLQLSRIFDFPTVFITFLLGHSGISPILSYFLELFISVLVFSMIFWIYGNWNKITKFRKFGITQWKAVISAFILMFVFILTINSLFSFMAVSFCESNGILYRQGDFIIRSGYAKQCSYDGRWYDYTILSSSKYTCAVCEPKPIIIQHWTGYNFTDPPWKAETCPKDYPNCPVDKITLENLTRYFLNGRWVYTPGCWYGTKASSGDLIPHTYYTTKGTFIDGKWVNPGSEVTKMVYSNSSGSVHVTNLWKPDEVILGGIQYGYVAGDASWAGISFKGTGDIVTDSITGKQYICGGEIKTQTTYITGYTSPTQAQVISTPYYLAKDWIVYIPTTTLPKTTTTTQPPFYTTTTQPPFYTTTTTQPPITCNRECSSSGYEAGVCSINYPPNARLNRGSGFCTGGETCWCVSTPTTTTIQPTTTSITTTTIRPPICITQQLNVFENIWNILLGWISRIQPKVICY